MERGGYAYIMTNRSNSVLYTGSTSDLYNRVQEHVSKIYPKSFTARYNINKLVYFEIFEFVDEAIAREGQIKKMSRSKKIELIERNNPNWSDLENELD
ncbi:MAG: GIY-YIG nuclease family protein [Bacteroides sp.]|nr:GIY-YIG nuclease family protein [Bacteroides sp.]